MPSRKRKQQQKKSTDLSEGEYFEKQEKEVNSFPGINTSMLSGNEVEFQNILYQEIDIEEKDKASLGAAFNNLGYCYAENYGVEKDLYVAVRCFRFAVSFGDEAAIENLARFTVELKKETAKTMISLSKASVQYPQVTSLEESKGTKRHKI